MDLPVSLLDAVRQQRAVLFLGTGASYGALHPGGKELPMGLKLRDLISDQLLGGALKDRGLPAVSAMAANEVGLGQLQKYIHDVFEPFQPAAFHRLLPAFRWKAIATTNYDLLVERSYDGAANALQALVKSVKDGDAIDTRMSQVSHPLPYYKLHGCVEYWDDETIPLILGQEQYASYATNRQRFYARLRDLAIECPIIFCGYRIEDAHIQQMLFDLTDKSISRPMYFHVSPGTTEIEQRYWASHRITCLKGTFAEFLESLDATIPKLARALPVSIGGGSLSIRSHYKIANAPESEAVRAYLETDVVHVHSGMATTYQDPIEFYKGHDTGFGSIAQNLDVPRAVEDSVLVDAVLVDETNDGGPRFFVLKGPAGNGKTVALKRTAWEAGTTYEQLVFYVSQASGLRVAPLQEIYEMTGKRVFVFVDRIALLREDLRKFLEESRSVNLPVTVIGAERDNEWNIYCENLEKFVRQDFAIKYLSEKAIVELLKLLERHKALGLLSEKTPEERVAAFTERAEKQLLVALHETTFGTPFEEIVLDEYKRIEPVEARRLYLDICALHQFGAPVRAGLISRASGITFQQFAQRFMAPLENVVITEDGRHGGDVFYRSRHQHVAELVFSRALPSDDEKFEVLAGLLQDLNIDYSSDNETWGRMIRGRSVSAIFQSVEVGRLFYDRAAAIDPTGTFVPHQRAVFEMSHREGSLVLAEEAARKAALINPTNRSVRHTQAEIARKLATTTEDPLRKTVLRRFARERLGGQVGRATGYDMTTRAKLAIDEFRELLHEKDDLQKPDETRLLEAAREAENAIQRGLQAYPDSAELMLVEANFRELLQQEVRARKALEKAFRANPRQDWLAIRLARSLVDSGELSEAYGVLEKCLSQNAGSKAAHLEIAKVSMQLNKAPALILDHLRRSFTAGDSNYEGQFWFARELFAQGQEDASKIQFQHINETAPGHFRTNASVPLVGADGNPETLKGTVVRKEEGYAFVHFRGHAGDVFCSRANSDVKHWEKLKTGSSITGSIAFSRRGPRGTGLRS